MVGGSERGGDYFLVAVDPLHHAVARLHAGFHLLVRAG